MRVGIISLTSGYNFGGTLQTVALSRAIEKLGHKASVIDYRPVPRPRVPFWKGWGLRRADPLRQVSKRMQELRHLKDAIARYEEFKKQTLDWSEPVVSIAGIDRVARDYDAIVVGSDQVWNLGYHPDPCFYLSGMDNYRGRRVSYAACCGNAAQKAPDWVGPALKKFDYVGVRNSFTADWVAASTGGEVQTNVVVDPTLLYDEYPDQGLDLPDKYIAVYLIGRGCDADHKRAIKGLRDKYGDLPILCLMPTGFAIELHDWYDKIYWHLTPFEWVDLIKRSTAVYTDSFHAVLFSMRNRVPFTATYVEPIRAPRLIDLQGRYALRDSICRASEAGKPVSDNDWQTIENYWKSEREHSMSLLANYLAK